MTVTSPPSFEPGSYRDRRARVFQQEGSVFRALTKEALDAWRTLSVTRFYNDFAVAGKVVGTRLVAEDKKLAFGLPDPWIAVLQHDTIPFVSYPYEWSFGMLQDAALLQLELIEAALGEEISIRDSTPFNIQWRGTTPVFVDISSFERLSKGEPWVGYRQFCRMFLYPLFLQSYKGVPFQPWLRGDIEGIEARHLSRMMCPRDYFRPGLFVHLYLHAKAEATYGGLQRDVKAELRSAGFNAGLILANVRRLTKLVRKLSPPNEKSLWVAYQDANSYGQADRLRKVAFVRQVAQSKRWKIVWDFGCNTGIFSRIASENADYVVAFDADGLVIDRLYQSLKSEASRRVLPLVVDMVNPSPGLGWRGLERRNLTDRGTPELIICLALIHHIVIGANVPLDEFIDWLVSFDADVLIEFVGRDDPMVQKLLRNRSDNCPDYNEEQFCRRFREAFDLVRSENLDAIPRTLYFGRARRH